MTIPPLAWRPAVPEVVAHAVGSPEFYWALVAELSILLFAVLLLLAPRWAQRRALPRFRLVGFGAALLASLITLLGKLLEVWPGHPLFPSGHTAFAVTVSLFLVALDSRWLRVVVPLAGLLVIALVLAHYHVPIDIAGGAVVGLAVFAVVRPGWHAWTARSAQRTVRP